MLTRVSDWIYLRARAWRCFGRKHEWRESNHWTFDAVGGGYVCRRCGGWRVWSEPGDVVHR